VRSLKCNLPGRGEEVGSGGITLELRYTEVSTDREYTVVGLIML